MGRNLMIFDKRSRHYGDREGSCSQAQLLCTAGGNQARSDARSEFEILEPSPKGGGEAGRAMHCMSLLVSQ